MELQACPHCGTRVIPSADGSCPSCRQSFHAAPVEVVDEPDDGTGAASNPYASPLEGGEAGSVGNIRKRLAVPAVCLLVLSLVGAACALVGGAYWVPSILVVDAPVQEQRIAIQTVVTSFINVGFCILVLLGAIAMLRGKPWWLAVAGCCAALVPLCGPCFVLAIPFGAWGLRLLFSADVRASFR